MGILFLGTFNIAVDNTVHLFGVFISFLFWIIEEFHIKYRYFFTVSIIYGVFVFYAINF